MKVKFNDLDFAYEFLQKYHLLNREKDADEGEEWKNPRKEEEERIRNCGRYKFCPVELFYPLNTLTAVCEKIDGRLTTVASLTARNKEIFTNTSEGIVKLLGEGRTFLPTTPNLAWHFYTPERGITSSIIDANEGQVRFIGMGKFGAHPRFFSGMKDFMLDMGEFEREINLVLNHLYAPLIQRGLVKLPENLTLHLNLTL